MSFYLHSEKRVQSAQKLIQYKIDRKNILLKKHKKPIFIFDVKEAHTIKKIFLIPVAAQQKRRWRETTGL